MEASLNQVKQQRLWAVALLVLLAAGLAPGVARAEPRVVIISVDGLRPDVALRADMPNLRQLMRNGAFSFWATTTPAAITLPSHASMLTGVTIERHGIKENDDDAAAKQKLLVPSIFDIAHAAGMSSALVSGKSKFSMFAGPVDVLWCPVARKGYFKRVRAGSTLPSLKAELVDDDVVGVRAADMIEDNKPRLLFVHFAMNDFIGHSKGWGCAAQIANLTTTDAAIGRIVMALKTASLYDDTTIIVTADHGGSGRQHGKDDDPSKFIPWIIEGPGVRKNSDLSLFRKTPIQTYDTFATACSVLGLTMPPDIDGRPVSQAFEETELLQTRVPTTRPTSRPATEPATETTTAPATGPTTRPATRRVIVPTTGETRP